MLLTANIPADSTANVSRVFSLSVGYDGPFLFSVHGRGAWGEERVDDDAGEKQPYSIITSANTNETAFIRECILMMGNRPIKAYRWDMDSIPSCVSCPIFPSLLNKSTIDKPLTAPRALRLLAGSDVQIELRLPFEPLDSGVSICINEDNVMTALIVKSDASTALYLGSFSPLETKYQSLACDQLNLLLAAVGFPKTMPPQLREPAQILQGADIEFSIVDSDGIFHDATEFFKDDNNGPLGTDGNAATVEIRPKVSKDPRELTAAIAELLETTSEILPEGYDFLAGGGYGIARATGLHVHFSNTDADYGKSMGKTMVKKYIEWLECLVGDPLYGHCRGLERGGAEAIKYGRRGDWRSRWNHEFSHSGWEWRRPATICIDRKFTEAFFAVCYMVVRTASTGCGLQLNKVPFSVDVYKSLVDYEKFAPQVETFVHYLLNRTNFEVPVLREWFGKTYEKDRECDVKICFSNSSAYLSIKDFVMYNPQKLFNKVVILSTEKFNQTILTSTKIPSLTGFVVSELGYAIKQYTPSNSTVAEWGDEALFVVISNDILEKLVSNPKHIGSRNYVKMFVQRLVKNI